MTGFEVVGVVLGSIPLLISALEHYSEGLSTMNDMREYESVFENLLTAFNTGLAIYRNSCEELLSPLLLPDNKFNDLLENRSDAWEDSELEMSLKERLGRDYQTYKHAVGRLDKKIILFGKKLKLGKDMRPPWIMENDTVDEKIRNKFFNSFWTRISGGFNSDKYAKLLDEILGDIDQINKLTEGAIQNESLRREIKRQANDTYWISLRDHAKRLYQSLSSRWPYTCPCKHPHRASLRLDVRNISETDILFGFVFSFDENPTAGTPLPWNWRNVEIKPLQASAFPTTLVSAHAQPSPKKTVRFTNMPSIVLSTAKGSTYSQQATPPVTKISDLCKILGATTRTRSCLGLLDDQHSQHLIYCGSQPCPQNEIRKPTSLEEILNCGGAVSLATKQKCTLALTLASATLQLYNTPWMNDSWDLKDIYVFNTGEGVSPIDLPYVSKSFATTSKSTQSTQSSTMVTRLLKNKMVFALGVALLEMSYGRHILSLKTAKDSGPQGDDSSLTKIYIAYRLVDEIGARESKNYADAARRCIHCCFDTSHYDLDSKEFRDLFYQGVVLPLQRDYDFIHGINHDGQTLHNVRVPARAGC
ncbi:hypothetical protein K440DRAFT_622544 [Wilcoxina mikolae CBS 423.85]|nr:hypothetical protein K440DRAFT_622544 [Wilcoxina mikolae CBS 423.85]